MTSWIDMKVLEVAAADNTDEDTTDNTEVQSAVSDMETDPGKRQ